MRSLSHVVAAFAVPPLLLGAGTASAEPGPAHWRIFAATGRTVVQDLVANRPSDAWAAGFMCANHGVCDSRQVVVENWNGRSWRVVRPPRGLPAESARVTVGAGSPRNAWLFAGNLRRAAAFHWNGRTWRPYALRGASAINSADVFGPRSAWVFGLAGASGYVARFNGRSWRQVRAPGPIYYQEALGPSDIWAVGPTRATQDRSPTRQVYVAMRWDGRVWREIALPRFHLRNGRYLAVYGLAALGARNLWLDYSVGNGARQGAALLHWTGRWHEVRVPYSAQTYAVQRMVPDGSGGLWLAALAGDAPFAERLYHYRAGRWSEQAPPAGARMTTSLQDLSWIPGTASVWGAGTTGPTADGGIGKGVILRCGWALDAISPDVTLTGGA